MEPRPICDPPWNCIQSVEALHAYTAALRTYVIAVLDRTIEHIEAAREVGVTTYPVRVIDRPTPIEAIASQPKQT